MYIFRKLLGFGKFSYYLGYSAMHDFFPMMRLKPNSSCDDSNCRAMQIKMKDRPATPVDEVSQEDAAEVVHEDNDWGKELYIYLFIFSN
jgi:ubiquitin-like modifier-activating enzyme 5